MIVFRQLHARAHRRRRCALASSAGFALRGRAQRAEGAVAGESDTMRMMAALPCCSRNVVGELTALQTNSVEIDDRLALTMLGNANESAPRTRDSFFDDDDDDEKESATPRAPPPISSIRIITSKPPACRRRSESSSSPSPSSCYSDHDVTDVSSIGVDHHRQSPPKQQDNHQQHSDHDRHHPFHLQSMRHVLLGSSAATSRPPSPAHHQAQLTKKHVRIVTDEIDKTHHNHHHHSQHQPPYIHEHAREYRRMRLTSSAVNRQKQQQRIERENLRLLERLQQTRASRGLKRDELLNHYDHQMGYVNYPMPPPAPPRARLPSRPSSATMMATTATNPSTPHRKLTTSSRPSSASHAINGNHSRSRPASATGSLRGSSRSSSARRPIWNDRWQQQE